MNGLIGQQLGQYEIIALLGTGGMASVYRARQRSMNRDVAIKVIDPRIAQVSQFVKRFEREVQTVASLSHPHILKVFDYGEHNGVVYLVMELLSGGSLVDLIRAGYLPSDQVMRLLDQVASALDYAHRQGIIHRDLKPANVLLDGAENAFLTDFGIAKLLNETTALTHTGGIMGTPSYMAPEQWQAKPADARTDLYALGVMVYEMLAGQVPFRADTPFGLMHLHLYEPLPALTIVRPDLPNGVQDVLNKAMAKNPADRFQSASAMALALGEALTQRGKPLSSPPRPRPKPALDDDRTTIDEVVVSPTRSKRGLIVGVLGLIILIGMLGGIVLLSGRSPGSGATNSPSVTPRIVALAEPTITNVPAVIVVSTLTATAKPSIPPSIAPTLTDAATIDTTATANSQATDRAYAQETLDAQITLTVKQHQTQLEATHEQGNFFAQTLTAIPTDIPTIGSLDQQATVYSQTLTAISRNTPTSDYTSTALANTAIAYQTALANIAATNIQQFTLDAQTLIAMPTTTPTSDYTSTALANTAIAYQTALANIAATAHTLTAVPMVVPIPTFTPQPTSSPTPTKTAVRLSSILYQEKFDGKTIRNWDTPIGTWAINKDSDGSAFWHGIGPKDYPQAWYRADTRNWINYVWEFKIRFPSEMQDSGGVFMCFRAANEGSSFYAFVVNTSPWSHIARFDGKAYTVIKQIQPSYYFLTHTWYLMRIEAQGDKLSWFINDTLYATVNDSTFKSGGIGFYMGGGDAVDVADMRIWKLP